MKPWRIRPIPAVAALTAFAVATIAISTALLLWNLRTKDLAHARGETVSLSHILAEQTTRTIQNVDLAVQNTQAALETLQEQHVPLAGRATHELLHNQLSGMPQMKYLFVTDAAGTVMSTSRIFPADGVRVPDREYFIVHRDNPTAGLFIGAPTRNRVDGGWTLYMSRRLGGPRGEFRGVIAVALNLDYFESLYESISFDGISPIALSLADGTLVARQPHDEGAVGTRIAPAFMPQFGKGNQHTRMEANAEGQPRIVTYQRVSQFPLLVSVAIDEYSALEGWRAKTRLIAMGAGSVAAFVMLAAWALALVLKKDDALTQQLRETGERLAATINSALDGIIMVDAEHRIILFNPAAEKMFACKAQDAIGASLERFVPERHRDAHRHRIEAFGDSEASSRLMAPHMEVIGVRADGQEFPVEASISKLRFGGEALYTAILRDVTERREAEEQLYESNRQLRELSGSLQTVREEERTRIARELHDELGQQLTRLKLDLSWVANQLGGESKLTDKLDGMKGQIDATIKSVRRISTELRPPMLDDLGLCPAIEWLSADFSRHTGVAVALELATDDCQPGDALVTTLYRIVQEGLTNVARHAEASRVRIALTHAAAGIELTIADDGKGMAETVRRGQGLVGIRERALMLGGAATFESASGSGTTIRVVIPLPAATERA